VSQVFLISIRYGNYMNVLKIISLPAVLAVLMAAGCAQDTGAPAGSDADSVADTAVASGDAGGESTGLEAGEPDINTLLAGADPALGKRQFIFCQACHTVEVGGANKLGPNLAGIVGQEAAVAPGFVYSPALTESGLVWDAASLDQWITNPSAMVPGTTMVFAGIKDPEQRANLIAYLQEVANPVD
jgi:cytochrome c